MPSHILNTTLEPNRTYSTLGIELSVPRAQETFSNEGNFSIRLNGIDLNKIQEETNNAISKDTPIFIYVEESNQTFIAKLKDNAISFKININRATKKDENGNIEPINTKNIFLTFYPFLDTKNANNDSSQKLQITATDLDVGYKRVDFAIPYSDLKESEICQEWKRDKMPLCLKMDYQELKIIYRNIIREKFPIVAIDTLNIEEGIYELMFDNILSNSCDSSANTFSNDTSNAHKFYSIKLIYKDNLNNSNTSNDFQKPIILTNNNSISQDDNALYVFIEDIQDLLIHTFNFYEKQCDINQIRVEVKPKAITLEMLRQVFNRVKDSKSEKIKILQEITNELNRIHEDGKPMYVHYKLDTKNRLEHFFAQSYVEVGGSALWLEESFNYSVDSLLNVDGMKSYYNPKNNGQQYKKMRYATFELFKMARNNEAKLDGRNDKIKPPQKANKRAIANKAYGTRLGNNGGDDGYNFRGRGLIHLTGRENYTHFQAYYNKNYPNNQKDFINNENHRNELITNTTMALISAVWFWTRKKAYQLADKQDKMEANKLVRIITKNVNGGYNGLNERQKAYKRIKDKNIFKDFD